MVDFFWVAPPPPQKNLVSGKKVKILEEHQ